MRGLNPEWVRVVPEDNRFLGKLGFEVRAEQGLKPGGKARILIVPGPAPEGGAVEVQTNVDRCLNILQEEAISHEAAWPESTAPGIWREYIAAARAELAERGDEEGLRARLIAVQGAGVGWRNRALKAEAELAAGGEGVPAPHYECPNYRAGDCALADEDGPLEGFETHCDCDLDDHRICHRIPRAELERLKQARGEERVVELPRNGDLLCIETATGDLHRLPGFTMGRWAFRRLPDAEPEEKVRQALLVYNGDGDGLLVCPWCSRILNTPSHDPDKPGRCAFCDALVDTDNPKDVSAMATEGEEVDDA